jgi:hypothetical protein
MFSQRCYWRFNSSWMRSCFVRRAVPYRTEECNLSSACPILESSWAKWSRRRRKYYFRAVGNYFHNGTTEQRRGSESSVRTPLCPCQEADLEDTVRVPSSAPTELTRLLHGCLCSGRLCQVNTHRMGQNSLVSITTIYRIDGMGIESQLRFSAPVQTDPKGHPASG